MKWNSTYKIYVNSENLIECNWGAETDSITYILKDNIYRFREWDINKRLVALTQISKSGINNPRWKYYKSCV